MNRVCCLLMLMMVSSSAHAGGRVSFAIGGHRIRIEAPRGCRSASCLSVSIPGIFQNHRSLERTDTVAAVPTTAPAPPVAIPSGTGAGPAAADRFARKPACHQARGLRAATTTATAGGPTDCSSACARSRAAASENSTILGAAADAGTLRDGGRRRTPVPDAAAQVAKVSHQGEDEVEKTPRGLWQSRGGSVRIEACGSALCGYMLNPATNASGEAVLVNMKPKAHSRWAGSIYSRDSGEAYDATMTLKGPNALRVEACAWGRFFCTGNVWNRIGTRPESSKPEKWINSRQISSAPRP